MRIRILSDDTTAAVRLRHQLLHLGHDCPLSLCGALEHSDVQPSDTETIDIAFIVLPEDAQRGIELVQKLRGETNAKLVVVGPTDHPTCLLASIHAGADDYLDARAEDGDALNRLLERLRSKGTSRHRRGALVSVISSSGGVGASLVSSNLAVALAGAARQCVLMDLVWPQGDQASLLNLKPRHSLDDLCRSVEKLDSTMLEQTLVQHESGVRLLAGPQDPGAPHVLSAESVRRVIELARSVSQVVVADVDAIHFEPAMLDSDQLIVLLRMEFTSIRKTRRLLERISRSGRSLTEGLLLVANRSGQPGDLPQSKVERVLGHAIDILLPDDPEHANFSVNCGTPISLLNQRSRLARALEELSQQVAVACRIDAPAVNLQQPTAGFWQRLVATWGGLQGGTQPELDELPPLPSNLTDHEATSFEESR